MAFAARNMRFALRHPARTWRVSRLCREHVAAHPECAWCGRDTRVQAHHVIPVAVAPDLAEDPDNLISLCAKRCHITLGHNGDYARRYVPNVREVCDTRSVLTRSV